MWRKKVVAQTVCGKRGGCGGKEGRRLERIHLYFTGTTSRPSAFPLKSLPRFSGRLPLCRADTRLHANVTRWRRNNTSNNNNNNNNCYSMLVSYACFPYVLLYNVVLKHPPPIFYSGPSSLWSPRGF